MARLCPCKSIDIAGHNTPRLIRRSHLLSKTATVEGRTTDGWIDGEEERVRALGVFEPSSGSCLSVAAISAPTCVAVRTPASGLTDRASCCQAACSSGLRRRRALGLHQASVRPLWYQSPKIGRATCRARVWQD